MEDLHGTAGLELPEAAPVRETETVTLLMGVLERRTTTDVGALTVARPYAKTVLCQARQTSC